MHTVKKFMATPDEYTVCMGDQKIINLPTFDEAAAFASYLNGGAKPAKTVSLDPFEGVSTEAIFDELRSRGVIPDTSK